MYLTFDASWSSMAQERGGNPPHLLTPSKRKKHVCEFCGRDDFLTRHTLWYHRHNTCEKRQNNVKPEPSAAADPQDPREDLARRLSTTMVPFGPPPEEKTVVAARPPKPPAPALAAAEEIPDQELEIPDQEPDESDQDQEEPAGDLQVPRINPALFIILLLLIAVLAVIVLFWHVIEREGKKFLKQFDPPALGVPVMEDSNPLLSDEMGFEKVE